MATRASSSSARAAPTRPRWSSSSWSERPAALAADDYEILDERFGRLVRTSARVDKLFEGTRWAEGPAYFAAGRYLVWSDIPNDRILRWDEPTGTVGVFRSPAGYTNGHTVDRRGGS